MMILEMLDRTWSYTVHRALTCLDETGSNHLSLFTTNMFFDMLTTLFHQSTFINFFLKKNPYLQNLVNFGT